MLQLTILLTLLFGFQDQHSEDLIPGALCTFQKDIIIRENTLGTFMPPSKSDFSYYVLMVADSQRRTITKESKFKLYTSYNNDDAWETPIRDQAPYVYVRIKEIQPKKIWIFKSVESGTFIYVTCNTNKKDIINFDNVLIRDLINITENGKMKVIK